MPDGVGRTVTDEERLCCLKARPAASSLQLQDAHPLVRQHAHWQTEHPGGRGAARDVCELIMSAQGTLERELEKYTQ